MAKARRAIRPFTPDYCCEAHIVAYSGLFGKEINQVLTVYGDYGDKEKERVQNFVKGIQKALENVK